MIIENYIRPKDRKKLGNVVFYVMHGKNILRTKPISKTASQKLMGLRGKKVMGLINPVYKYIKTAYDGWFQVKGLSAYCRLMSINLKKCFINNPESIEPGSFVLCENEGSFVGNVVLTSTAANTITGVFSSNAQNEDEERDIVYAYGINHKSNKSWHFDQEAIRDTGTISLSHPGMSGSAISVYFECLDRVNLQFGKPKHVIQYVGTVDVMKIQGQRNSVINNIKN